MRQRHTCVLAFDSIASIAYLLPMATLTIRNLPDKIRDRLRMRAAKHGVSMEAEARKILASAVEPQGGRGSVSEIQDWVAKSRKTPRAEKNEADALIRDRRREAILDVLKDGEEPSDVFGSNYRRVLAEADWTEDHVRKLKLR